MDYETFLASKRLPDAPTGIDVAPGELPATLFAFQRDIVSWALHRGRAAIFAATGLGKTAMQLAWAQRAGSSVLIVAPLAVSRQTQREGEKFGVAVNVCKDQSDVRLGINITNYERLDRFDPAEFTAMVLDESSILKSFDGATRRALTEFGRDIPMRLCATATPAPNDYTELGNHAEFLDVLSMREMLSLYFTQDGNSTQKWRLKGHAREPFWRWVASWAVALNRPSDVGRTEEDARFELPPLNVEQVTVGAEPDAMGQMFATEANTLAERRQARRATLDDRVAATVALVDAEPGEPWVLWCDLNAEQDALERAFGERALSVYGSLADDEKERRLFAWLDGERPILIAKPSMFGLGLNLQRCARVAFVGLSDSFERYFQAIRRCWRFGQEREVNAYVVTATSEGAVVRNIERKERQAGEMMERIVANMAERTREHLCRNVAMYERDEAEGQNWRMLLGDCVERLADVEDESVGLSVFSPPFPSMYVYTNSPHDMGNVADVEEMIGHFGFLLPELRRVLMPGRTVAIHLAQALTRKRDGDEIGLRDFRGATIQAMQDAGFTFYGEVTIDKDPQVKAIRTKDRGLLFKTLASDSAHMRMAQADYLLQFRKPGENPVPIRAGISERYGNEDGWITPEEWIEWAAPVWYRQTKDYPGGIRETDVLNVAVAREGEDERHLCPLQLGVIERAVKLWSAPGETVLSPFAGVGSEGVTALRFHRRFVGVELKRSYFETAVRNLRVVRVEQPTLLDEVSV